VDHGSANILPVTRFEKDELELAITRMSALAAHSALPQVRMDPTRPSGSDMYVSEQYLERDRPSSCEDVRQAP
jgi:hypothetical protein